MNRMELKEQTSERDDFQDYVPCHYNVKGRKELLSFMHSSNFKISIDL